ncbi:THAP domain-containing protein 2-like [Aphis gossypii]|uniref:THAP domain-containing protein 2-like n=1 Tax=Aphis gossypii TaxID=80765 RepID=UPI00215901B2|nr:THAP domain-containing protein 2-like [Aphis gossypii]
MGGCTAVNCSNSRRKGIRLFRFPKDISRRKIWLQNCRRDKWVPTESSELCEIHFEENQFEQHRLDGLKKLKSNAIPTLFDVPNPPRMLETKIKSLYKTIGNLSSDNLKKNVSSTEKRLSQATSIESNVTISENYSEPVSCLERNVCH